MRRDAWFAYFSLKSVRWTNFAGFDDRDESKRICVIAWWRVPLLSHNVVSTFIQRSMDVKWTLFWHFVAVGTLTLPWDIFDPRLPKELLRKSNSWHQPIIEMLFLSPQELLHVRELVFQWSVRSISACSMEAKRVYSRLFISQLAHNVVSTFI